MAPRKPRREQRDEPVLPFDATQEIDPALADELRRTSEPTLSQDDFAATTLVLPDARKPR